MSGFVWKPHVTVAALVERQGRFLLVREKVGNRIVLNQPAGHLEKEESLIEAVVRETREETSYEFIPTGLQGIYRASDTEDTEITYLRFLFLGVIGKHFKTPLDDDILSAEWLSLEEITACRTEHRSPLVMQGIEDYLSSPNYPLDILSRNFS